MFEKKDRKLATILTVFFLFGLLMMAGSVQADLNKAKEHFNTAVKAKQDGNVEGAIIAYKAAINEEPGYVDPYMNLGAVYFESKDYENALDMFRKATDADKTNVGAFSSLGRVEFKLKKEGYQVTCKENGEEALKAIREEKPDLILLDVMMPVMDGYEVLRQVKEDENLKNIPVVMLTARAQERDVVKGIGSGAEDYITKPFHPAELLARVKRILGKSP